MTPLLFIPGMMCDARLFAPQIAAIHDRAVMVVPIGGHDHMEALADEILSYAPPRFALAGLSMGGIVAMEIIRRGGERVERLCLMDTNPLAEADEVKARRKPQIEKIRQGKLKEVMRDEMKPNYLYNGAGRQEVLDLCMEMALALGPQIFIRQSRALQSRPDQCETLRRYKGPTLILHGEDDRLCPASRHELMHELIPHSRYEIITGAGHLPSLEQPAKVSVLLREWLAMG